MNEGSIYFVKFMISRLRAEPRRIAKMTVGYFPVIARSETADHSTAAVPGADAAGQHDKSRATSFRKE